MRKVRSIALLLLILSFSVMLSCCAGRGPSAGPDEIILSVGFETEDDVYQVAVEYWAGDTFCGGTASSHADGSRYGRNETASFIFDPSMFPDGRLPEKMSVSFMLADSLEHMDIESLAGRVGFCDPCDYGPFDVLPGTVYRFVLSGSFSEGFRLSAEDCV